MCQHLHAFLRCPRDRIAFDLILSIRLHSPEFHLLSEAVVPPSERRHQCLHCSLSSMHRQSLAQIHASPRSHHLSLELYRGLVWCHACRSFVFEYGSFIPPPPLPHPFAAVDKPTSALASRGVQQSHAWKSNVCDVKGIANLGNTCFMSCIVQAFMSVPLFRNYFLSLYPSDGSASSLDARLWDSLTDRHGERGLAPDPVPMQQQQQYHQLENGDRDDGPLHNHHHHRHSNHCSSSSSQMGSPLSPHNLPISDVALALGELTRTYFLEPPGSVLAPSTLMHRVWTQPGSVISGYAQQDAQEFYMALVGSLPSDLRDKVFTGMLSSSLTCTVCGASRVSVAPTTDVSLQVMDSLQQSLELFTKPEMVENVSCATCGKVASANKEMAFRVCPPCLVVHLKRFRDASTKIDNFVSFPLDRLFINGTEYDCVTVVQHKGSLERGHYTCAVRRGDRWFHIDDDVVEDISADEVSKATAYLLVYCQRELCYSLGSQLNGSLKGQESRAFAAAARGNVDGMLLVPDAKRRKK